ncbi:MAG: hypothetical protein P8I81_18495, partial [Pseudomonadales bacterium]|nr:hypothetical protein [Pseudomonadales bacterium]
DISPPLRYSPRVVHCHSDKNARKTWKSRLVVVSISWMYIPIVDLDPQAKYLRPTHKIDRAVSDHIAA